MDAGFRGTQPIALEAAPPLPETEEAQADAALIARVAGEIVRRRMATPAILFLESVKPLNFVGSQFLTFMDPILRLFLTIPEYRRLVRMLEERTSIERMIQAIEKRDEAPA